MRFTKDAADLLLKVQNSEPQSCLALLSVTLMNEDTTFNLFLKPDTNQNKNGVDAPRDWWDVCGDNPS
jgi:hypothetical protein